VTGAADTTPEEAIPPKAAGGDLPIGKAAIFGFAVAHFSHHVTNSLLSPLLPLIRDTFALSYTQQGLAVSASSPTASARAPSSPAGSSSSASRASPSRSPARSGSSLSCSS